MTALQLTGSLLSLLGVLITAAGLARVWRGHAKGNRFWGPLLNTVSGVTRKIASFPWLSRASANQASSDEAGPRAGRVVGPGVVAGSPRMDELSSRDDERWRQLEHQIRLLSKRVEAVDLAQREGVAENSRTLRRLQAEVRQSLDVVEKLSHASAIEGLRWEGSGLFLIGVGTLLQVLGGL